MAGTRRYVAVFEQGEDRWIVVTFPSLPGCVTQGQTREEALANAQEALELTIESMLEEGEPLPEEDGEIVEVTTLQVAI